MKTFLRIVLKPLSFVPALIIMYMIYSFSAQDGVTSSHTSGRVTVKIVQTVDKVFDMQLTQEQIRRAQRKTEHYIRKCAHFGEYMLLAISIALPLYVYGLRGILLVFVAGAICVGYASFDEFHQLSVSGRSGSKKDVLIDSLGSFAGIYFVRMFGCFLRYTIFNKLCTRGEKR